MKKKRLTYMDEVKPSLFYFIIKFCLFGSRRNTYNNIEVNLDTKSRVDSYTDTLFDEYKEKKEAYKLAKNIKETSIKHGKKYKGKIVKTEISTNLASGIKGYRLTSTAYEYYAVVEFTNDKGEIIRFKTERLSDNPEYLTSKDVSVYVFNDAYYATDFGYIEKPTKKISDSISDSFKMKK